MHHDATLLSVFSEKRQLCFGCQSKIQPRPIRFNIDDVDVLSFVKYDANISQLLILYKEHKDEALAPVFFTPFSKKINKEYKAYIAIPLPSSKEKVEQRGFHHLHRMIESLNLDVKDVFMKRLDIKQAKMSKQQRGNIDQIFDIRIDDNTFWENVVLIDDVCTTGASLQAAIRLLRPYCKNLRAITFAYHPLWKSDG